MGEFTGPATRLADADYARAATSLGCPVAAVRAVALVESKGGFLADKRPKILFERHIFHRLTEGRFSAAKPAISNPTPGGYRGGAAEYDRLAAALACDRLAALKSASWGAFQIMGFNHKLAGFPDVASFVRAMVSGEAAHLTAFVAFVKASNLADELVRRDWAAFARGYNGPDYRINRYDEKLAEAYAYFSTVSGSARPVLREGATGVWVEVLQRMLGLNVDGGFGPGTRAAVERFQQRHGLPADGVVGQRSWVLLLG